MGKSDGYLNSLWRKAVLERYGNKCAWCGQNDPNQIECHHISRRKNLLLRWKSLNGIPLCITGECHHRFAHTKLGENRIRETIGDDEYNWICREEQVAFKQRAVEMGITRDEYTEMMARELKVDFDNYKKKNEEGV